MASEASQKSTSLFQLCHTHLREYNRVPCSEHKAKGLTETARVCVCSHARVRVCLGVSPEGPAWSCWGPAISDQPPCPGVLGMPLTCSGAQQPLPRMASSFPASEA